MREFQCTGLPFYKIERNLIPLILILKKNKKINEGGTVLGLRVAMKFDLNELPSDDGFEVETN